MLKNINLTVQGIDFFFLWQDQARCVLTIHNGHLTQKHLSCCKQGDRIQGHFQNTLAVNKGGTVTCTSQVQNSGVQSKCGVCHQPSLMLPSSTDPYSIEF